MKRRTLLIVGAGTGTLLAIVGGTFALLDPGLQGDRLAPKGRRMFAALAVAILGDLLPSNAKDREQAIAAHLGRIDDAISACQPAVKVEINELITLLVSLPGRVGLAGLGSDWSTASVADVQASLQGLRTSSLSLRQQVYHALHKLTTGPYFAGPSTWQAIGYPGPRAL